MTPTENKRKEDLLSGPVLPLLLRMSAPNTVAFLISAIVVLTEVLFISKLGTEALAAVALAFPIIMFTQQMAFGALGGAVTSSIARSLGAGNLERAERLLWHSLFVAICGSLFFLFFFIIGGESLLKILGGEGSLLNESFSYSIIFLSGGITIWLSGVLTAALRGMGNMIYPAIITILASLIQVVLAGGLILGWFGLPKMGIAGAAISVIANGIFMSTILLLKFSNPSTPVRLKLSRLSFEKELFQDIFNVALPASLSPVFTVATVLILTGLVAQFGTAALAGYGIGSRVEFLMIPLIFGIGSAMTTMVGTNVGAKNIDRAEKIGFIGGISAGLLSGIIGVILALTPEYWIHFFTNDEAAYLVTKQYIQIVGICYGFQGLGLSLYFASQGANAMRWAILATIARCLIAAIGGWISVYYFSAGITGIFYSAAAAVIIYGFMLIISLRMGAWRKS